MALAFVMTSCTESVPDSYVRSHRLASLLDLCAEEGVDDLYLCGTFEVPEHRGDSSGSTIELHVVVLPSMNPNSEQPPLFELAGGPGAAASEAAVFYANEGKLYQENRDIVLVDQRGTGSSNPLHCPKETEPQTFVDEMYPVSYVTQCLEELERQADLTQYTTPIAMEDLDAVRDWLGYETISVLGFSYGTRAALTYMRMYPERVHNAVLVGVSPPDHTVPLNHAVDGERALNLLLEDCRNDTTCQAAYPELEADLLSVLTLLEAPQYSPYMLPESGDDVMLEIQRDVFAEAIRTLLYSPETARQIPYIIDYAKWGNFSPFFHEVIPVDRTGPTSIANGVYLSISCNEGTRRIDLEEARGMNASRLMGNYRVEQEVRACNLWPEAEMPSWYWDPVTATTPTLILSGRMDPITPPSYGEKVAATLPNSTHLIIPHLAHLPEGLSDMDCFEETIRAFLDNSSVDMFDTACLQNMMPPPFYVEE